MNRSSISHFGALLATVVCAAAPGCGGSDDGSGQFLGTWRYDQVVGNAVCHDTGGDSSVALPPTGNKTIAPGIAYALTDLTVWPLTVDGIACNFGFDIAGPVATAKVGQTCKLDAANDQVTVTQWTFTLTGPTQAEEMGVSSIVFSGTDPLSGLPLMTTCDYTVTGTLTKVAKN